MSGRVIKFRVWDTIAKAYWHTLEGATHYGIIVNGNGDPGMVCDFGMPESPEKSISFFQKDRLIVEQFTGLLDPKGQEIYEGDILRWCIRATPIPTSVHDSGRHTQFTQWTGEVTWGVVPGDMDPDVLGWTLKGVYLHQQEGRPDLSHPFEQASLYNILCRHADDTSYPDSSWQRHFSRLESLGNIHQNPDLLKTS